MSEELIKAVVEAMRDDPFIDDHRLLGTSQQDDRMEHYARIALACVADEIERLKRPAMTPTIEAMAERKRG